MALPFGQTIFHSVTMLSPFAGRSLVAYFVLTGMLMLAWAVRRQHPVASVGIVTFLLLLLPAAVLTILGSGEPWPSIASTWPHRLVFAIGAAIVWLQRRGHGTGSRR
jgi:hypothetical protein